MINKIKNIGIIILIILVIFLGFKIFNLKKEIIKVPVLIEIPVAGKLGIFKSIKFPIPKKEKLRTKLEKNFQKSDTIIKDSLYRNAITERFYEEIFEDSIQKTTVRSKVQGKLLEQELDYFIKPDTIQIDTVIDYKLPSLNRLKILTGLQINANQQLKVGIQPNLFIQDKKNNLYHIGYDIVNKNYSIGIAIKL